MLECFTVIENDVTEKYLIKEKMWMSKKGCYKAARIVHFNFEIKNYGSVKKTGGLYIKMLSGFMSK